MRKRDWKRKNDDRNMRSKAEHHWRQFCSENPRYAHQRRFWCYNRDTPSYPVLNPDPLLKKHRVYPRDIHWNGNCCPKTHNKLYHIRPVRRHWKKFCRDVGHLMYEHGCDLFSIHGPWLPLKECYQYLEGMIVGYESHLSEGVPYPTHKRHVYWD